ncbi:MAG: EAL domain-containing protein [Burkholderiaceae bacterium]|nr:EAL domain-containing protein [Burkholderiaceae bacterium]
MTTSPFRVLLLEDNDSDAMLLLAALDEYAPNAFAIVRASRLAEALRQIDSARFDVILSDLALPDSFGLDTVSALVSKAAALPLVVLTGSCDDELGRKAILHGAQDFLIKGDSSGSLIARTLRHAIEHKRLDIALRQANEALERRVAERTAALEDASRLLQASERQFRALYDNAPLPYQSLDIEGNILTVNEAWLQALDLTRDEAIGRFFGDFMSEASKVLVAAEFSRFKILGNVAGPVFEFVRKDGSRRLFQISGQIARDGDGNFVRTHCILIDVTEAQRTEAQLKLAANVFDQSTEGITITDAERNIVLVNRAFTAITGYSREEVIGKNPRMLSSGRQDEEFYRAMWESIGATGLWQGEMWNRRKDGSEYPEWISISRVLDSNGGVKHYIAIFSDITQRKEAEERIQWLAHFDALTGLPNRVLAADRARQSLSMMSRNGEPLALMFINLDHFKNVNDSLGHHIGDVLLVALAERLTGELREQDTVSRLGGDEFVLVLPGADATGAAHLAEKLINMVAQSLQVDQHELRLTASIGIAMYPNDADDFESLCACADVALHHAKSDGRNTYRFFTREMQERSTRRVLLENELHRALERNELSLHYQPQISMHDGRLVGAEALLRWRHPILGMVSPAEFIPIAESSGLILPIGEWVLRSAVQQWKSWLDSGLALTTVAVNLSAVQFKHPSLTELVMQILEEAGLAPQHLELELTEGIAMDDPLGAIAVLDRLHERGIRMSIDDFGTGYSSLSYLKRFKIYKLKIDQSFVRDLTVDQEDKAIVGAIISLAANLGMQTIAEGVETQGQLEFLRGRGCNEVQGYYFSKPLAVEDFEVFARGNRKDAWSVAWSRAMNAQIEIAPECDFANCQSWLEYQALLDNETFGIAVTRNRTFVRCSSRLGAIFGWPSHELVGQPTLVVYPSAEAFDEFSRVAIPILGSGQQFDIEMPFKKRDGSSVLCRLLAKAIDPADHSKGAIYIVEDITSLRTAPEMPARVESDAGPTVVAAMPRIAACVEEGDGVQFGSRKMSGGQALLVVNANRKVEADNLRSGPFMQLIWHPAYESGNEVVDAQHRALVEHANLLLEAMLTASPNDEVAALVDELIRGTRQHFESEEEIIAAVGFPGAEEHAAVHRELVARAGQLQQRFHSGTLGIGELFQFLAYQLIAQHMLGTDREFFHYLTPPEKPGSSPALAGNA